MKKLLTITLALCAVIVAQACGSNVPEVNGISGSSIRDAASKTTVENWLKRLGVNKQSTDFQSTRTRSSDSERKYAISGQPANGQNAIYIQGNKKLIKR